MQFFKIIIGIANPTWLFVLISRISTYYVSILLFNTNSNGEYFVILFSNIERRGGVAHSVQATSSNGPGIDPAPEHSSQPL